MAVTVAVFHDSTVLVAVTVEVAVLQAVFHPVLVSHAVEVSYTVVGVQVSPPQPPSWAIQECQSCHTFPGGLGGSYW